MRKQSFMEFKRRNLNCYIILIIVCRVIVSELFTTSMRNYLLEIEPLIQISSDDRTIHCALLCSINPNCLTYAFNKKSLLCYIQGIFTKDWSRLKGTNEDGWIIYASTKPVCEDGWITMGNTCYLFNEKKLNWTDAQAECMANHSFLVEINSEEEHLLMENYIFLGETFSAFASAHYWIGGTYVNEEGRWVWSHTNRSISDQGWDALSMLNAGSGASNCLYFLTWIFGGSIWRATNCSLSQQFVCERKMI